MPSRRNEAKTLIDEFHYPRLGTSQFYERLTEELEKNNGSVLLEHKVTKLHWTEDGKGRRVTRIACSTPNGDVEFETEHVISSMPYDILVKSMSPEPPEAVVHAANQLRYRSSLVVHVIVDREHLFPDNWIYVHDPDVRVSRIENVKNWTDGLLPDLTRTPLGMEYFVDVGDNLWEQPDEDIVRQASEELVTLGFIDDTFEVIDGMVTRMPLTYCVHDGEYAGRVSVMREFTDSFTNLQPVGRYGMFKYNNQDHSILTGLLAGRNVAHGASHDIWSVNADAIYHEAKEVWDEAPPNAPGARLPLA